MIPAKGDLKKRGRRKRKHWRYWTEKRKED